MESALHLFQYPLKRKECANEHKIKKCFFKTENREVKLELEINTDSPNFDTRRAHTIADEIDGERNSSKNTVYFENEIVDRVYLESTKAADRSSRYAIAAYNGKEIHLTTLKGNY